MPAPRRRAARPGAGRTPRSASFQARDPAGKIAAGKIAGGKIAGGKIAGGKIAGGKIAGTRSQRQDRR